MNPLDFNRQHDADIHLSFSQDRLKSLIREGKLHAADFTCLDKPSKRTVWSLLLSVAAGKL